MHSMYVQNSRHIVPYIFSLFIWSAWNGSCGNMSATSLLLFRRSMSPFCLNNF